MQTHTPSILDGYAGQSVIDPALGAERDVNAVLTHQVVDNGIVSDTVFAVIKFDGGVLQNTAVPDNLKGRRDLLLRQLVLFHAVRLFFLRGAGPAGFILRLPFGPICRRQLHTFGKVIERQRPNEIGE